MTNRFDRRQVLAMGAGGALLSLTGPALAADFPGGPLKIVVHSSAGGNVDAMVRKLAEILEANEGWSVVVENRPGGSGAVSMSYVMTQPADGLTLLTATGGHTFQFARGALPFTIDDFEMVMTLQGEPCAIVTRADSELNSLTDFVEYLRENPGGLRVGGFGTGGYQHFVFYELAQIAGIEANWIPFDSASESAVALLGGHLDVAFFSPSAAVSQIEAGDLKLLGMASAERTPYYPDVPTFIEEGYDVASPFWRGLIARAGIPEESLAEIRAALVRAQDTDEWKDYMERVKVDRWTLGAPEFGDLARAEVESRQKFLKELGIVQ